MTDPADHRTAADADASGDEASGVEVADTGDQLDLTPREVIASGSNRRVSALRSGLLLAVVLGALGFVLVRGLSDATLFFYNADEAIERRDELGDRRFRLQGAVVDGSLVDTAAGIEFTVTHEGAVVRVAHAGDPPSLFQPDIPVVVEGRWQGSTFQSDRILVKHSEKYEADNPDRVDDYPDGDGPSGASAAGESALRVLGRSRSVDR